MQAKLGIFSFFNYVVMLMLSRFGDIVFLIPLLLSSHLHLSQTLG